MGEIQPYHTVEFQLAALKIVLRYKHLLLFVLELYTTTGDFHSSTSACPLLGFGKLYESFCQIYVCLGSVEGGLGLEDKNVSAGDLLDGELLGVASFGPCYIFLQLGKLVAMDGGEVEDALGSAGPVVNYSERADKAVDCKGETGRKAEAEGTKIVGLIRCRG